jgi:hypothetical protein
MPAASLTTWRWPMMVRPMPMLRPKRVMPTQPLRPVVPKWCRSRRRLPRRLPRQALQHPMGPIFFLNLGSP